MKVSINFHLVGIVFGLVFIGYVVWAIMASSGRASSCDKSCGKLKAQMIDERCHCNTAAGWTPASKASWIDRKVTGKK